MEADRKPRTNRPTTVRFAVPRPGPRPAYAAQVRRNPLSYTGRKMVFPSAKLINLNAHA
jgi:hypothetical protein